MSLLLDALKRAEQEKLARQSQAGPDHDPPQRPAPARDPPRGLAGAPTPVPGLQLVEGGSGPAQPRVERPDAPPIHDEAAQVRKVFAAKAARPARRSRTILWAALGAAVLLLAAGGGYVWYTIRSLTHPAPIARRGPMPVVAVAPAPTPPAEAAAPAPPPEASPAAPAGRIEAAAPAATPRRTPAEDAEEMVATLLKENAARAREAAFTLSRSSEPARVLPDVAEGYAALRAGDLEAARRRYSGAIAAEPANLDAQLGLATVEARLGNRAAATERYRQALALDPGNAAALAGLAALADFSRPEALEMQLRADLAANPRSAALHATLGHLYASQRRWTQAQAAYFEGHRLDPGNPDILYNLAVSLDHLGQARLAADFYARALEASRGLATPFDRATIDRRLAEIRAGR